MNSVLWKNIHQYESEMPYLVNVGMGGWMTCDFTDFSTEFQSYQDDGRMIMKGCLQWNPCLRLTILHRVGLKPRMLD